MSANPLAFDLRGVTIVKVQSARATIGLIPPGAIISSEKKLDELTLVFPENPLDGQLIFLTFSADIKVVNLTNATLVKDALFTNGVKAGDTLTLFYHKATNKWYKLYGSTTAGNKSK